ncbi:Cpsf160 [Symbiodinium sp. KB8]|nr:Cpsf160 [Symbiodinium sp. KB8]
MLGRRRPHCFLCRSGVLLFLLWLCSLAWRDTRTYVRGVHARIRWGHLHLQAASQLLDDANAACDLLSERLDTFSEHLNSSSGSWEQAADGVVAGTADDASFRHVLEDLSQELNCSRNHLTKALEQAEEVLSRLSEVQNELDALKRKMRGTPANYAEARAEDKNLCVEIDKRSSNYTQRTQNLADTVTSFMKALTGQRESMNLKLEELAEHIDALSKSDDQ